MLRQVVDRLNQWIRTQQPPAGLAARSDGGRAAQILRSICRKSRTWTRWSFPSYDGCTPAGGRLAAGHRALGARRSPGRLGAGQVPFRLDGPQHPARARHVPTASPSFPGKHCCSAGAPATERAWVFMLLARHLGIEAALLALNEPAAPRSAGGNASAAATPPAKGAAEKHLSSLVRRRADRGQRLPVRSAAGTADSRTRRR